MKKLKSKKQNNASLKAMLGTIAIFLVSIGIFVAVDALFPFRRHMGPGGGMQNEVFISIFSLISFLSTAILLLSVYLIFIYLKDYLELRSGFTLGVLAAVVSFMLFAISSNPILQSYLGLYGGPSLFSLIPYFFAAISLGVLAWVSSK